MEKRINLFCTKIERAKINDKIYSICVDITT